MSEVRRRLAAVGALAVLVPVAGCAIVPPVTTPFPSAATASSTPSPARWRVNTPSGVLDVPMGPDADEWLVQQQSAVAAVQRTNLGPLTADWDGRLHLVVAADEAEYLALTGRDSSSAGAVTDCPNNASRIVLSSGAAAESATKIAGLLEHEAVHAATGSACESTAPLWVDEGLAEWVAGQNSDWMARVTAEWFDDYIEGPETWDQLPSDDEFSSTRTSVSAWAYARAATAVRIAVKEFGRERTWKWLAGWTGYPMKRDRAMERKLQRAYSHYIDTLRPSSR